MRNNRNRLFLPNFPNFTYFFHHSRGGGVGWRVLAKISTIWLRLNILFFETVIIRHCRLWQTSDTTQNPCRNNVCNYLLDTNPEIELLTITWKTNMTPKISNNFLYLLSNCSNYYNFFWLFKKILSPWNWYHDNAQFFISFHLLNLYIKSSSPSVTIWLHFTVHISSLILQTCHYFNHLSANYWFKPFSKESLYNKRQKDSKQRSLINKGHLFCQRISTKEIKNEILMNEKFCFSTKREFCINID